MISSDMVVGGPDMVKPGENGEVYKCGDIDALGRIVADFANAPDDAIERMKRRSFELATNVLSFQACADGLAAATRAV
jgi:glycosyltransferase involved in cell wall biosynthesis